MRTPAPRSAKSDFRESLQTFSSRLLQLPRSKTVGFQQVEQAVLADDVQRADHDHVVPVGLQQLFDLRSPAAIPVGDERRVEAGRHAVFLAENARELRS